MGGGSSDGGARTTKFFAGGSYTTDLPGPGWWRDTKKISLEEAHYHLSYLPAQAGGFHRPRASLREGAPADIVVYDPGRAEADAPEWEFRGPATTCRPV